jgi:hypothetical protein
LSVSLLFVSDRRQEAFRARAVLRRLPALAGEPIRILRQPGLREGSRVVHAGSFLRDRRIEFNCSAREFARVFVHEVFHFVWLRLGNDRRRSYEDLLRLEFAARARGELGWSAEWRKHALRSVDWETRSHRWRQYCCESFCDSAAWLYAGVRRHEEFTLAGRFRRRRRDWLVAASARGPFSL